jgi:hypothetical protein
VLSIAVDLGGAATHAGPCRPVSTPHAAASPPRSVDPPRRGCSLVPAYIIRAHHQGEAGQEGRTRKGSAVP